MSLLGVRTVADSITFAGKIAVCAIGAGVIEPGESDCGVAKRALLSAGTWCIPDAEHPATKKLAISATAANERERRALVEWAGKRLRCFTKRSE